MDLDNYDKLLDDAYNEIPENAKKSSRFEVPKVQLRFESKNTYITNFNKILNILNRDRKHFIGYLLKNAGTMGEMRGPQLFLKGEYKAKVLNRIIEDYTDTYVLCDICNKPDTKLKKEGKKTFLKCAACGARLEVNE
ncbi:MAG: Translation initiation factor 2 subunit beta [Promethearchaeota archaeon]|nr:MAG: Translation initiation factor 2 subunit beta [Candidatus Lokiarchaeota archaeon]